MRLPLSARLAARMLRMEWRAVLLGAAALLAVMLAALFVEMVAGDGRSLADAARGTAALFPATPMCLAMTASLFVWFWYAYVLTEARGMAMSPRRMLATIPAAVLLDEFHGRVTAVTDRIARR